MGVVEGAATCRDRHLWRTPPTPIEIHISWENSFTLSLSSPEPCLDLWNLSDESRVGGGAWRPQSLVTLGAGVPVGPAGSPPPADMVPTATAWLYGHPFCSACWTTPRAFLAFLRTGLGSPPPTLESRAEGSLPLQGWLFPGSGSSLL